ncbi:hypothetical protein [Cohaesibacter marisflavi]|uniref:hypothetical protein n=1 Tax=Cohaesibacter marisflavi TaxID=655353 RepID=UPI0029C8737A|nr:hypothetical protein [Cohaesibacter marisflavi]
MTDIDKALAYVREMIECSDDLDGHEDREDLRRVETLLMKLERLEREALSFQGYLDTAREVTNGLLAQNSLMRDNWPSGFDLPPDVVRSVTFQTPAGSLAIVSERLRQIEAEGWTAAHDDEYDNFELVWAGITYAHHASIRNDRERDRTRPSGWPWADSWWKPEDRRRDLVKAGALIAAEIDRLDRAAKKGTLSEGKSEAATFQLPPDAKVTLSLGELPSIAREPGARRLPVLKDVPEVEWSEPENLELVLDEDGVKRWMLSTRDGQVRVGHDGLVLEMRAEHYKAGTKLCLEEPLEDLWNDQEGGAS